MSARTSATVRDQSNYPEAGPATKTLENCDVANGNKVAIAANLVVWFYNSDASSHTITFTYDDDAGVSRTNAITLAAGEAIPVQLEPRLGRHAADSAEAGLAWFTANGSAGHVKMQAVRLKSPLMN